MKSSITVRDDFCEDIERVRASAIASGFGTWSPNKGEIGSSKYDGMNFWGEHSHMLRALTRSLGCPVYPNSMFFRVTTPDTEPAYVHSDRESGDWTCVAYLSEHDEVFGTGFYRHTATGMDEMPTMEQMATPEFEQFKKDMVAGPSEPWVQTDFIGGKFNRALIFRAPMLHARFPVGGIGETPETARMVWVCHFNL